MKRSFCLLATLICAAGISEAGTVYSATLAGGGWYTPSSTDAAAFSWTQTGSYTNVSIAADLTTDVAIDYPPEYATVNAYLVNQIGTGTTMATNEVASVFGVTVPYYFNDDISGFGLVTLFSGLSLGPGTYYVVINPTSGIYDISFALGTSPTIVTDTGVTAGVNDYVNDGVGAYVPSWDFISQSQEGATYDVDVESDVVPEPSTLVLSGSAIGLLFFARLLAARRRQHS